MNPSTQQAAIIVDELINNGISHVVLCPGSRNAPLSFALYAMEKAGRLNLHVRIDERSAGFLALGIAKSLMVQGSDELVAVVCTSGTAVANFHPAVLEAHYSDTPLLVLTADRPPELVAAGANQTIQQTGIFLPEVSTVHMPMVGSSLTRQAVVTEVITELSYHKAVHLNVPFREPLVPEPGFVWPQKTAQRALLSTPPIHVLKTRAVSAKTLLVMGYTSVQVAAAAGKFAGTAGFPVLAEPTSRPAALAAGATVLDCGVLLASVTEFPEQLRPETVIVVGRPTLSRGVRRLIDQASDQLNCTTLADVMALQAHSVDMAWLKQWTQTDQQIAEVVADRLQSWPWPTGLQIAADLTAELPAEAMLFLGSSNPIRDVDLVGCVQSGHKVIAHRGVSGIDGGVSSAIGAALAAAPAMPGYALLGDLSFVHDLNGLLIGPNEVRPDVTIIVLNDNGGGIFSLLEQGSAEHQESFERIFGTPHGAELSALCAGYGVPHHEVRTRAEFREVLRPQAGLRVIEVCTDRRRLRSVHEELRAMVQTIVTTV